MEAQKHFDQAVRFLLSRDYEKEGFQKCIATDVFTTAEYQNAVAMLKWISEGKV